MAVCKIRSSAIKAPSTKLLQLRANPTLSSALERTERPDGSIWEQPKTAPPRVAKRFDFYLSLTQIKKRKIQRVVNYFSRISCSALNRRYRRQPSILSYLTSLPSEPPIATSTWWTVENSTLIVRYRPSNRSCRACEYLRSVAIRIELHPSSSVRKVTKFWPASQAKAFIYLMSR